VRTFGRIVSLEDFADQARQFAGIAKASAVSEWNGEDQVAYLTVAGVDGAQVVDPTFSDLVADLNIRRDPNRSMRVRSYVQINIQVAAQIDVDPSRVPDDVQAAANTALIKYLSFDNLQFGQPIHLSSIYAVLQSVPGVLAADVLLLQFKSSADAASHGATSPPVQEQLAINANELAWIDDSNPTTAPDIKYRTFGFDLTPTAPTEWSTRRSVPATMPREPVAARAGYLRSDKPIRPTRSRANRRAWRGKCRRETTPVLSIQPALQKCG